MKSILDRFLAKPEWQSPDAAVRAAAVLRLSSEEREMLVSFADDPDPRVRKAAVKKIHDPVLLGRLAATDTDEEVREEAEEALLAIAVHSHEAARAGAALEGLRQPKRLLTVVRSSAVAEARRAALAKLSDAKALAAAAREAPDADLRLLAVARLDEPGLLLGLAQNSEHKPVALAAVEKLEGEAALRAVAGRAKSPAAARRARARLEPEGAADLTAPVAPTAPPPEADEAEREAYERKLAEQLAEQEGRARALAERAAVCEKLEVRVDELAREAVDEARGAWEGLAPLQGSEAEALQRRFEAALEDCQKRAAAALALADKRAQLEPLLVEAETAAQGEDLAAARTALVDVQKRWLEAGAPKDGSDSQRSRLDLAAARLGEREAKARAEREAKARQDLERLKSLAGRLEGLARAGTLSLKDADRAVREAKDALDHLGALPQKKERDALHGRLEAARKALYPRLQELRADTEWKRWANESVQEELVARAEALRSEVEGENSDLEKAGESLRDLDARWKAAADVDKAKGEALWKHFKAARDEVKAKVDAWYEQRAAEFAENLKKKEALIARAFALQGSTEWLKTADELKKLQADWKAVGPTAHGPGRAAWERFRKSCDLFFTRREEDLKQRKDEWGQNETKKQALIERAQALSQSTDWEAASAEVKKLQADWKAVGPVKKTKSEALWQTFRSACDLFFERYKRRDQIALEKGLAEREAIVVSLESLATEKDGVSGEGTAPPEGLAARVTEIQGAWRQAGPPSRESAELGERFRKALHALVAAWPDAFQGSDLDPAVARKKAEKLCARVEALRPPAEASGLSLAEQLKDALATNTMGGRGEAEARRRATADEVRAAREAFARLPPLPGPDGEAIRARFEAAARRVLGEAG